MMGKRATRALAVLLASGLSCGACGNESAADRSALPRDSAGVAIYELHGDDRAQVVELAAVAGTPLDFADPAVILHGVIGGVRLGNDRVALGSRFTGQIVFYDAQGRGLRTFGREGSGPGEFARLASLVSLGADTIAALDGQYRRISLLTQNGLIATTRFCHPNVRPPWATPRPWATWATGDCSCGCRRCPTKRS